MTVNARLKSQLYLEIFSLFLEDQFYEQFTAEEKNKLYDAIGYQENEADPTLPKEASRVAIQKISDIGKSCCNYA